MVASPLLASASTGFEPQQSAMQRVAGMSTGFAAAHSLTDGHVGGGDARLLADAACVIDQAVQARGAVPH